MDKSPIRDLVIDSFKGHGYTKDSKAWLHGLVIAALGMRLAYTTAVAVAVALMSNNPRVQPV